MGSSDNADEAAEELKSKEPKAPFKEKVEVRSSSSPAKISDPGQGPRHELLVVDEVLTDDTTERKEG